MAINALQRTLDRLRIVLAPDLPDEKLLNKFIAARDEIAFATLVRRHGRMVLEVARRILGNLHDSEDVLQATFLVLAQKARLVGNRAALASWLYKVAYRIALKAKARNYRRRQKETQVDAMPHSSTPSAVVHDWEALLDEDLNRLPEKYRLPVILCDLEGRTRKEVEHQLQLEAGTLSSRLTRARRMLADRLTRRGVVLSGGALWTASSQATAALPPALVAATAQKAVLVAAGQLAAISSSVTILMKAGVKAMFISKLKATVATVLVLAALGAGGLTYSSGGGEQAGPAKPKSELEKLRHENDLLKLNLRVTLEKIQTLENEVRALKGRDQANVEGFFDAGMKAMLAERLKGRDQANAEGLKLDLNVQTKPGVNINVRLPKDKELPDLPQASKDDPRRRLDRAVEKNSANQLKDLDHALSVLREATERKDAVPGNVELLRHAAQTLEHVLNQLRDLERIRDLEQNRGNRP